MSNHHSHLWGSVLKSLHCRPTLTEHLTVNTKLTLDTSTLCSSVSCASVLHVMDSTRCCKLNPLRFCSMLTWLHHLCRFVSCSCCQSHVLPHLKDHWNSDCTCHVHKTSFIETFSTPSPAWTVDSSEVWLIHLCYQCQILTLSSASAETQVHIPHVFPVFSCPVLVNLLQPYVSFLGCQNMSLLLL